jgi:hypothetical protein
MGQLDLLSPISSIIGGVFGIATANKQADIAKQQSKAQLALAKAQAQSAITQMQYAAALQAQQDAVDASKSVRNAEIVALVAIGGAAVLISLMFLRGATKK